MRVLALVFAWAAVAPVLSSPQYPTVTIDGDTTPDWLLHLPVQFPAPSLEQLDNRTIALTNTLIARVFTLEPEFATWDIQTRRGSALRAVSPEGEVTLDGVRYTIGGLVPLEDDGATPCPLPVGVGPANNCPTAYLNRSTPYGANASAFHYRNHSTAAALTKPFAWEPNRHAPHVAWPPLGLALEVDFVAPGTALPQHRDVVVTMRYELLQGTPRRAAHPAWPSPTIARQPRAHPLRMHRGPSPLPRRDRAPRLARRPVAPPAPVRAL